MLDMLNQEQSQSRPGSGRGGEMKITGEQIIDAVAKRLNEEGIPPSDNEIVRRMRGLNSYQILQLATFGNTTDWHNEEKTRQALEGDGVYRP